MTAAYVPENAGGLALLHLAIAAKLQETIALQLSFTTNLEDNSRYVHTSVITAQNCATKPSTSLQEQIAIVQLADEQQKHTGEKWELMLLSAGKEQTLTGTEPTAILRGEDATDLSLTNIGDKNLYAALTYQGYGATPPEKQSSGDVSVTRNYWNMKGEKIDTDNTLTMDTGDMVIVELLVYSKKYRPDLLMVDHLPAGLEIENQNLPDSTKLSDITIDGEKIGHHLQSAGVVHDEFRDDRYVAAHRTGGSRYYGTRPARMYYIARAVTPGT